MTTPSSYSEDRRQLLHIAMGVFALLLRYIAWWEGVILAGAAIAFNLFALPRIAGRHLYRDGESARRYTSGIILYPVSIALLLYMFPDRRDIVAGAWGVLAFGDGMATIVGRHVGGPRIPWNRDKSFAGSAALVLFGGAAGAFLCWWCRPVIVPPPYAWFTFGAPFAAALAAAAVETIPIKLDDNVSVPIAAASVLWWSSHISEDVTIAAGAAAIVSLPLALTVNAAVASAGYLARTVTTAGALCGAGIGTAVFLSTGWVGWALLMATFISAVIATRLGHRRKTRLGIAEPRGGRRGAGNAFANTGVAAFAAVLAAIGYVKEPALVAFVAALAAGGSDTIASEIGKAWGRPAWLVPTFRAAKPGTPGAVSIAGTAAGLIGAFLLAGAGVALDLVPGDALLPVVAGATVGSFAESAMGATLEGPGIVNNDVLNFLNTAIAAAGAVLLAKAFA